MRFSLASNCLYYTYSSGGTSHIFPQEVRHLSKRLFYVVEADELLEAGQQSEVGVGQHVHEDAGGALRQAEQVVEVFHELACRGIVDLEILPDEDEPQRVEDGDVNDVAHADRLAHLFQEVLVELADLVHYAVLHVGFAKPEVTQMPQEEPSLLSPKAPLK